jgi:hypothetical protein
MFRPAKWEPCRISEVAPSKIKVGWLYWEAPDFQIMVDRRSARMAQMFSHTRGFSPHEKDRVTELVTSSCIAGDVMGAGIDLRAGFIYFTRNGQLLMLEKFGLEERDEKEDQVDDSSRLPYVAYQDVPLDFYFPSVELRSSYCKLEVNLGQQPFLFNDLANIHGKWTDCSDETLRPDTEFGARLEKFAILLSSAEHAARKEATRVKLESEQRTARRLASACDLMPFFHGATEQQIMIALELNGDDPSRTVNWALEQGDILEAVNHLEANHKAHQKHTATASADSSLTDSVAVDAGVTDSTRLPPVFDRAQFWLNCSLQRSYNSGDDSLQENFLFGDNAIDESTEEMRQWVHILSARCV